MTHAEDAPYRIEAATIPERYGRGWHCLGLAADYTAEPQMLSYFGTRLVAYRGEDGQVRVMDAFCPHMGGNLAKGKVCGNSIVCPFHAWSWGPDGRCDHIPYATRIPAKALIKSWPTLEENHLLFVWNDPENGPPIPEQRPPQEEHCFSEDWSDWHIEKMTIHTNARELVDNMADWAHFPTVHGAACTRFRNIVEGHNYTQEFWGHSERLAEGSELFSRAIYHGPAYMLTYQSGKFDGVDMEVRLLVSHVPIDTESFDLRFGVLVRKDPGLNDEQNAAVVAGYAEANRFAFFQDVEIWHTKCRVDNPLLCDGDGPIHKLRQWYAQFYVDRAEVPASIAERKVYERTPKA